MATTEHQNKTTRSGDFLLIGMFFLLIFAPICDSVFHIDRTPFASENRLLSSRPRYSAAKGLKQYFQDVETYANDHFGFRNYLVRLNNKVRYSFFADQNSGNVIIGKDDWLFFAGDGMVDHYRGTKRFNEKQLETWRLLLERRQNWLAQKGIKYLFVIAPDKQTIYPEHLPDWLKRGEETKLDQFLAYMKQHSTISILDLRTTLQEARKLAPTYYNTDTHWNYYGGFVATREIMEKSSLSRPLELDWFEQEHKRVPGGDLVKLLGLDLNDIPEANYVTFSTRTNSAVSTNEPGAAVVFHDSFAEGLRPFLQYHFGKVAYSAHYELDPTLIEEQRPSVVISEIVERYLNTTDVESLLHKEHWSAATASAKASR